MHDWANEMTHLLAADLDHVLEYTAGIWEPLRRQRLFMTGGTGFVGTWLTESLVWANTKLDLGVETVLLTRDPERFRAKAPHAARHKSIKLLRGNAQSFAFPEGEFGFVIHAATECHSEPTQEAPVATFDADLAATRRVLEFARQAGTRRMLFTSSGAVYGRQPDDLPGIPEDYPGAPMTTDPKSAYGHAKRASEFLCAMYSRQFGCAVTIGRLFAFIGPHLPLDGYAVGNFIRDIMQGRAIQIESDGTTVRSYLYAADMSIWLWTILLKGESLRPYNVGSSRAITVNALAKAVAKTAGGKAEIAVLGRAGVPATRYVPDTSRSERELGLLTRVPLEESLKRTREWYRVQAAPVSKD